MKIKAFLLTTFLFSTNILLDYTPLSIKQLIDKAEIIAKCEIITVDKNTFTVKFVDVIKGEAEKQSKIIKFKNWTCASRVLDYKIGQTELIFLEKNKNGWQALGAGNEGENIIQKNNVYFGHYIPVKKRSEHLILEGENFYGLSFEYSEVKNAIVYYMENSESINNMTVEEIKNFKSENTFLQGIVMSHPHKF